jgi:ABC-type uncharacterized transport system permease subunit
MEVVVSHASEMDHALDSGVRELQAVALTGGGAGAGGGGGILVTKHSPGRFTLELSHDVPFGYTHEKS